MKKLSELFEVEYGHKFDLNKMRHMPAQVGGIDFVGRSSENNGVTACVAPVAGVAPYPAGTITVALGGSRLLSSFVQFHSFYTAQNVAVLRPRTALTFEQKVFLCVCIGRNRFRYSAFGREANRTLKDIELPDLHEFPGWVQRQRAMVSDIGSLGHVETVSLPTPLNQWRPFRLGDLFAVKKGRRLIRRERAPGPVPFVGASMKQNGVVGYVSGEPTFDGGRVSIPYNGNGVGYAMYQPDAFNASDDVHVLDPLQSTGEIDQAALMFVCVVLRRERYRYSFGRKWHLPRMRETVIRLPVTADGKPHWRGMSAFMSRLPFAALALDKRHQG